MRTPKPHQIPIVDWVKQPAQDRCALCMDMRLGKNLLTAHWLAARNAKFALIVAPISAHQGWVENLKEDGFNPFILEGTRDERCRALAEAIDYGEPVIFITNAESLFISELRVSGDRVPVPTEIALYPFQFVIWDEFVVLANPKNQCNIIAQKYLSRARYKCILSGEYTPEGVLQVFEPMRWLLGEFMGYRNFWRWRADCFYQNGFEWTAKDCHKIRAEFSKHAYILSRKSAGVQESKEFERRYCDLPGSIRQDYVRIERNLTVDLGGVMDCEVCGTKGWLPDSDGIETMCKRCFGAGKLSSRQTNLVMVTGNWLMQIAGGYPKDFPALHSDHKSKLLLEVLAEHAGKPVVVSYRFNRELFACSALLDKQRIRNAVITGDTPQQQRAQIQRHWSAAKKPYPLLVQCAIAAFGANFAAADVLIRYSLPLSYNLFSQGASRIFNLNKANNLLYVDLLCRNTVDEAALEALTHKRATARLFMQQFRDKLVKGARGLRLAQQ